MTPRRRPKPNTRRPAAARSDRTRVEPAPAKVNLTLRVIGRRADGYHDIESLVAFAGVGDVLSFTPGGALALAVNGPNAAASGHVADNLVLGAARALAERIDGLKLGRFVLTKRLPVAAGLGGGSSDAAAALRLLARKNSLRLDDPAVIQAAAATGADVPVCLDPRPRLMRGVGNLLSEPLELPRLPAVLVNPGAMVATRDVFHALDMASLPIAGGCRAASDVEEVDWSGAQERTAVIAALATDRNDLEQPAVALAPIIADVLATLRRFSSCRVARMSGSGATCFGLFDSARATKAAARALRAAHPAWWVRATALGGSP